MRTIGALASAAWLDARQLDATRIPHWYVEIRVRSDEDGSLLDLNIYPEEWGFVFRHGERVSSIRVTDIPFTHGRDDFHLLTQTPALDRLGNLLGHLEDRCRIAFDYRAPIVRSNLLRATGAVRTWLGGYAMGTAGPRTG